MSLRAALAALDDGALEAAASKGLVRRAHRDHEAGLASLTKETPDAATLAVDGETVGLGKGGLKAATCSCPAQGLCRHILAAVILLRATPVEDTPAPDEIVASEPDVSPVAELTAFSSADLVKAFGRPALRDAEAILAAAGESGEAIAVEEVQRTCLVKLPGQPDVRYLAGLGLTGMIAKDPLPVAVAGGTSKVKPKAMSVKALQAAAVLAVRRLQAGEAPVAAVADEAGPQIAARPPSDTTFLDAVTSALAEAARAGLATAPQALEDRLLDLALSSRADALPRLAAMLRGIAEDLSQRRARAAAFEPGAALAAIAQSYALVVALRRAGDDPILRGAIRQPYADLPPLDLVGCGLDLWRTPTGARGATAHGLTLDGSDSNGIPQWYTLTLARAAGQDPFFVAAEAARSAPVWGRSLETLARGRFRLDAARATPDRRLSLGNETRLAMGVGGLAQILETHPHLFVADWSDIEPRLATQFSPSLRTATRSVPLLLRPASLAPLQFDAVEQRVWLPAMDAAGRWLDLTVAADAEETRLDAIAAMQAQGAPSVLVALATREGADLVLSPIAALAAPTGDLESFDLWKPPRPPTQPQTVLERLKNRLGALVTRERAGPVFAPAIRPGAATASLVALAEDEALALAELGGRMEDQPRLAKLGQLAGDLDAAGLATLAALLSRLATAPRRDRALRLLAFKHAAACHAALAPQVPLVRRLA